jgi:hypothetical protein
MKLTDPPVLLAFPAPPADALLLLAASRAPPAEAPLLAFAPPEPN